MSFEVQMSSAELYHYSMNGPLFVIRFNELSDYIL